MEKQIAQYLIYILQDKRQSFLLGIRTDKQFY